MAFLTVATVATAAIGPLEVTTEKQQPQQQETTGVTLSREDDNSISRDLQVSTTSLLEYRECIPFSDIPQDVVRDAESSSLCWFNRCDDGCCRIYNWLTCDTTNSFPYNACVCNGNTGITMQPTITPQPTVAPTLRPTLRPTFNPTSAPTKAPTVSPSAFPTKGPTTGPTVQPTRQPTTAIPTSSPTRIPSSTPTAGPISAPTSSPTFAPTFTPTVETVTASPVTTSPVASDTTMNPTSAPIETTMTSLPTSADDGVVATTSAPTTPDENYETTVSRDELGNPVLESSCSQEAPSADTEASETFSYHYQVISNNEFVNISNLMTMLHRAIANEFIKCNDAASQQITLLQSQAHKSVANDWVDCSDDTAGVTCVLVRAPREKIWLSQPTATRRTLQQNDFSSQILSFLRESMNDDGQFNSDDDTITFVESSEVDAIIDSLPTSSPTTQATATNTNRAIDGAEQQRGQVNDDDGDGPSTAIIVISSIGLLAVLAVLLLAVMRRRQNEDKFQNAPLSDADSNSSNLMLEQPESYKPEPASFSNSQQELVFRLNAAPEHRGVEYDYSIDDEEEATRRGHIQPLQEQDDLRDQHRAQKEEYTGTRAASRSEGPKIQRRVRSHDSVVLDSVDL